MKIWNIIIHRLRQYRTANVSMIWEKLLVVYFVPVFTYSLFMPTSHIRPNLWIARKSPYFKLASDSSVFFAWNLPCHSLDGARGVLYAYVTYPTISGRNCRSPERRRISNSPGSRAYFCLKCTLSHFGRCSGGALRKLVIRNHPAPVSKLTGVVRSPVDIGAGAFRASAGIFSKSVGPGRRSGGLHPTSCLASSDVRSSHK